MTEAIIKMLAYVIGWMAVKGVDRFFGKWVAYCSIAWELAATKGALEGYSEAMNDIKKDMSAKADAWKKWRQSDEKKPAEPSSGGPLSPS